MRIAVWIAWIWLTTLTAVVCTAEEQDRERPTDALKRLSAPVVSEETPSPQAEEPSHEATSPASEPEDVSPSASPADTTRRITPQEVQKEVPTVDGKTRVVVLPVRDAISRPNQYILRRGIKEAIQGDAAVVVLEIHTPGGRVDVMLEIMEMLDRFDGHTIAFVNNEAISAGALIASVCDEIWYEPRAVIGSAGIVAGGGQEIPETMRQKVDSYLRAKLRALSGPHPYRERVVRAMMDASYELEIDGKIISPAGEMLNLTAREALELYGDPPRPLFGDGMAESVTDLLNERFGEDLWEKQIFEVTWSENLAMYLTSIAPLLIALGIVGLFIEFKTPGFGVFGIIGITCLAIVFLSNYVAGLAGWEAFIILLLGLAFIALEIFLFPGVFVFIILGGLMVIGSILWSMTDIWPGIDGTGFDFEWSSLVEASARLSLGVIVGTIMIAVIWRLLPKTHLLDRLVLGGEAALAGASGGHDSVSLPSESVFSSSKTVQKAPLDGAVGEVTRTLRPTGEIEVDGKRYEARLSHGILASGEKIKVVGRAQFGLLVEPLEEDK